FRSKPMIIHAISRHRGIGIRGFRPYDGSRRRAKKGGSRVNFPYCQPSRRVLSFGPVGCSAPKDVTDQAATAACSPVAGFIQITASARVRGGTRSLEEASK